MPGKIFGQLRLPTPQPERTAAASAKHAIVSAVTETQTRRPSMEHIKRPSIAGLTIKHGSRDGRKEKDKKRSVSDDRRSRDGRQPPPPQPVQLGMAMESPPALFIGLPAHSTGALISGRLQVTPKMPNVILEDIIMYLESTSTRKRPVQDRCRKCMTTVTDLYEWRFLTKPKLFSTIDGTQELPFSHLIPGHLPATTHGNLASIDYSLHVRALASDGTLIEFRRDLPISRALLPGNDKNSVRIFPPTDLTLHVTLPNVVYPIGDFPVACRMTGTTTRRDDTQTRWRLRRLTWRIEEVETAVSPACDAHSGPKLGSQDKGIQHSSTREIGAAELKEGWKTDLDTGEVEGEFLVAINPAATPQCNVDVKPPTTLRTADEEQTSLLKITHNLVFELVIAEEWAPNKKPANATPTGAARVLRTHFALNLSQRAGMGISWDEENPPMYDDVPDSPPRYPVDYLPHAQVGGPSSEPFGGVHTAVGQMADARAEDWETPLASPTAAQGGASEAVDETESGA